MRKKQKTVMENLGPRRRYYTKMKKRKVKRFNRIKDGMGFMFKNLFEDQTPI